MTPKYVTFANALQGVLNKYGRNTIKTAIGDSTFNNRTVTVNQVIRFLATRRSLALKNLGIQLETVYNLEFIGDTLDSQRIFNSRTDAIDINEFLLAYNSSVVEGLPAFRRTVGRALPAAA